MTEIDYGRMDAIEAALGGRAAIEAAYAQGVAIVGGSIPETQQGASYAFALTDANAIVESTSATAVNFTVPPHSSVPLPVGTIIEVFQDGAGQVTIVAGAGVTLRSNGGHVKTSAQYATVGLRQRAQDEWVLSGDLA